MLPLPTDWQASSLYLTRTIPNISHLLQPLEDTIRTRLAPALTGRPPPNDTACDLLALPPCITQDHRATDKRHPLQVQNPGYTLDMVADQLRAKAEIHTLKRQQSIQAANQALPNSLKRAMDLAEEKGASSWLTSLPIEEFGFSLY